MATINFNGLASGLDTKSIVEQLTQIKQGQLITPVSTQLNMTRSKKSALTPINNAVAALKAAAKDLNNTDNVAYSAKKTDSSNSSIVKIVSTNATNAVNGTYNITNISQLAQPDRLIFNGVANTNINQLGTGTISITYQDVSTNISIDSSNNTLDGIRNAINDANIGVTASIISDGSSTTPYRLVLTSNDSGADAAITHNIDSILSLTVDPTSSLAANEPRDATFSVNSVVFHSSTNTIQDAIPGVSFELLGLETTDTITLSVKQDTSGIIGKIQTFVTSLNSARDALRGAIDPDSNNRFGPLGRDRMLQDAYYELGRLAALKINSAGTYTSLADMGISADRKGFYSIDSGKLTTALETNLTSVKKIFQGTTAENGMAERIYNFSDNLSNPIGSFAARQKQYDDTVTRLNKLLKDRTEALSNYQKKLQNQFNKLETTISGLKGQQDQLTGLSNQISGLGNGN